MRYPRVEHWLYIVTTTWVFPQIALAITVYFISRIIFLQLLNADSTEITTKAIDAIFSRTANPYYLPAIVVILILFFLALLARNGGNGPSLRFYWLARAVPWLSKGLLLLFRLLLVPMVLSLTGLTILSGKTTGEAIAVFSPYVITYFLVGLACHYLQSLDTHPLSSISYSISTSKLKKKSDFIHETSGRLAQVLSHVKWHAKPTALIEAEDSSATIVVPIYLGMKNWTDHEIKSLGVYLSAIELEWTSSGYTFSRFLSPHLSVYLGLPAVVSGQPPQASEGCMKRRRLLDPTCSKVLPCAQYQAIGIGLFSNP